MTNANDRFVLFPSVVNFDQLGITYQDALTYISIRSFHNSKNNRCNPGLETISDRAQASRNFIRQSIERLKYARLIQVVKSDKIKISNQYKFPEVRAFEKIPYQLFSDDLTRCEKAMMVAIRQFFNHGQLTTTFSVTDMATYLGETYNTVKKQVSSLIGKGYISEPSKMYSAGSLYTWKFTEKINWNYNYSPIAPLRQSLKVA